MKAIEVNSEEEAPPRAEMEAEVPVKEEEPGEEEPHADVKPQSDSQVIEWNAKLRTEVGRAPLNYVMRLRKNLGHPAPKVLRKMLEEVQATENVMTAAQKYICTECFERQGPAGVPPASGLTARIFGERLMVDTAWIDTDDGRLCDMCDDDDGSSDPLHSCEVDEEREIGWPGEGRQEDGSNIFRCQNIFASMRARDSQLNIFVIGVLSATSSLRLRQLKPTTGLDQTRESAKSSEGA